MPEAPMLPDRWLGPVELLPAASVPVAGKGARETVDRGGADEKPRRDAEAGNVRRRYGWRLKFPEQRLNPGWLLGLTLTTELGGVMIGYMAQDELNVGPAQFSSIKSLLALPWLIRPLYGLVSDCRPLFGYHRRSYLMLSGLVASVVYVVWAVQVHTLAMAVWLWALVTLSSAMVDVILDGASCEMSRGVGQSIAGALQSLTRLSFAVGALVVACVTGYMIDSIGSRPVILTMGIFMLINLIAGCMIADIPGGGDPLTDPSAYKTLRSPVPSAPGGKPLPTPVPALSPLPDRLSKRRTREERILRTMWSTLKQRRVLSPLVFVFLFMSTPQTTNAMFYFYTNHLGFTSSFLAQMAILARVADVVSSLLYARYFKTVTLRRLFFWAPIMATTLGLSQLVLVSGLNRSLGIPDQWFVFGDTIFLEVISRVALLHLMVLCSNLCPAGCESTMFAVIMSITSAAYLGLGNLGGSLLMWAFGVTSTDFANLSYLLLASNLLHLACLPLLCLVPSHMEPVVRPTFTPTRRKPWLPAVPSDAGGGSRGACNGTAQEQSRSSGSAGLVPDSELGFMAEAPCHDQAQPGVDRGLLQRKMRYLQRHHESMARSAGPAIPVNFDAGAAAPSVTAETGEVAADRGSGGPQAGPQAV
eukprot:jgi/Tetstr1/462240/TSEL_000638.t1